jgi:hypothetical protein
MKQEYSFQKAPRCSATSKRTRERCKAPAVRGWTVCRFHGARGGAPKGKANGAYKHGLHTKEAVKERRLVSDLLRQSRKAMLEPGPRGRSCQPFMSAVPADCRGPGPEDEGVDLPAHRKKRVAASFQALEAPLPACAADYNRLQPPRHSWLGRLRQPAFRREPSEEAFCRRLEV